MITEPIIFEYSGKVYKYHFTCLTVEQSELAREAGEFKVLQQETLADNFNQVLRSGGAEWKIVISRYLLREFKGTDIQPFDRLKAETEVEKALKNLPTTELIKIEEMIKDFFLNIGAEPISLKLFQSKNEQSEKDKFLKILATLMMKPKQENPSKEE